MDPISLIVAALAAGATAAAKDTAANVVKDTYAGLKALIRHRFGGNRAAEAALEQSERQPDSDPAGLAEQLRAVAADRDEELLKAAKALLQQIDPAGARAGKYDVRISGGKGVVVGDHSTITMNFNDGD
jgi:hypothetical protein